MARKLSQKNMEFIRSNYRTMSNRYLAELLRLDRKDIARALKTMGLERTREEELRLKNVPAPHETVKKSEPVDIAAEEKKTRHLIFIGILLLSVFIVYANSFGNDFVWDDEILVERNVYLRDWKFLPNMFTDNTFRGGDRDSNFWRPIQLMSYALDYHIWGLKPFGFHLSNTLFHALVVIMAYIILVQVVKNEKLAFMAALLYGIHPIHTEAVTYIAGRADSQCVFFMLAALSLYIYFRTAKDFLRYSAFAGSIVCMILSLLSKEMGFMTPALFGIYDVSTYHFRKIRRPVPVQNESSPHEVSPVKEESNTLLLAPVSIILRYAPFISLVVIYGRLRSTVLDFTTGAIVEQNFAANIPLYLRLLTFCKTLVNYFMLLFFPFNLHMERGTRYARTLFEMEPVSLLGTKQTIPLPATAIAFTIVAALLYLMVYFYKHNRTLFFGFFWFFITILPFSDLKPLNANMAEHWVYLSSIGFFLVIAYGLYQLLHFENVHFTTDILRRTFLSPFVVILILFSFFSIFRNLDWYDDFTIWKRTADLSNSSHIHGNLGVAYGRRASMNFNGWTRAKIIKFAKQNNIKFTKKMNIQQMVPFMREKLYEYAENEFKHAIRLQFNYPEAHNNLGVLMLRKNDLKAAEQEFKLAIKFNPGYANAHKNLGDAYERQKNIEEAKKEWAIAVEINPYHTEAKQKLQKHGQ